jgi:hypothetical protein
MTPRQSFNLLCQLQRDRVAKFLRPQSVLKSVSSVPPYSQVAPPIVREERSGRSAFAAGQSRKAREARIQIHRANRREHVARLFWNEL